MGFSCEVLEYINTLTDRWQAYLLGVFGTNFCENGVCSCYNIFLYFFLSIEAKQHMFLTTCGSGGRWYTKASHSNRNVAEEGLGEGRENRQYSAKVTTGRVLPVHEKYETPSSYSWRLQSFSWCLSLCVPSFLVFLSLFRVILQPFVSNMLCVVNH